MIFGLQLSLIGILIVFVGLSLIAGLILFVSKTIDYIAILKHRKLKKIAKAKGKKIKSLKKLSNDDVVIIALGIFLSKSFVDNKDSYISEYKATKLSSWK